MREVNSKRVVVNFNSRVGLIISRLNFIPTYTPTNERDGNIYQSFCKRYSCALSSLFNAPTTLLLAAITTSLIISEINSRDAVDENGEMIRIWKRGGGGRVRRWADEAGRQGGKRQYPKEKARGTLERRRGQEAGRETEGFKINKMSCGNVSALYKISASSPFVYTVFPKFSCGWKALRALSALFIPFSRVLPFASDHLALAPFDESDESFLRFAEAGF